MKKGNNQASISPTLRKKSKARNSSSDDNQGDESDQGGSP